MSTHALQGWSIAVGDGSHRMTTEILQYTPSKTGREFIKYYIPGELFYSFISGPYGSGKTTLDFFKLVYLAGLQEPASDGVRRTRAVIVRNTVSQLIDTTIKSWNYWFQDEIAGEWQATPKNFILRFDDVECEVLFRPLDTPSDVARVLSLDVTFAIIDEFVQIPRPIIDALSARCGRYPPKFQGGATNWGMWGASNPDTEDSWWYDQLYNNASTRHYSLGAWEDEEQRKQRLISLKTDESTELVAELQVPNVAYFSQPSGRSPQAENLENLPGGAAYYTNLMKGKSKAWNKQFVDAEWGFSAAGTPVVALFDPEQHIAKAPLLYNPLLPVIVGLDPGIAGSALVFTQMDTWGRLLVFGELVQAGYGAQRMIDERLKPYVRLRFPNAKLIIAPDPAAANRAQTDEKTVVDIFKRVYEVKYESNNRLPLRLDAIDHFAGRRSEIGPMLLVDPRHCPVLIRALKGGWRYGMDTKKDEMKGPEPEKNRYSHSGDSLGYAARYFHRRTTKELRHMPGQAFIPPRTFGAETYHFR